MLTKKDKFKLFFFCLLSINILSCGDIRYVASFQETEAYPLAKAIESEDLNKIKRIIKNNPKVLEVHSSHGMNGLFLSIHLQKFNAFRKLLELGANPNYINPYTKESVLMESCTYFMIKPDGKRDNRYAELLLKVGANPNYVVDVDYETEAESIAGILSTSPLIKASRRDLDLVKLLIKYKVDHNKILNGLKVTPFSIAVSSKHFDIMYYYMDSLKVDIRQPMSFERDTLYIQDYIKQYMKYEENSEGHKKKLELIEYLKMKGLDFSKYD